MDPSDRERYPHGFRVSRSKAFDGILEEHLAKVAEHLREILATIPDEA